MRNPTYEAICPACQTSLRFRRDEAEVIATRDTIDFLHPKGIRRLYLKVACPTCKVPVLREDTAR